MSYQDTQSVLNAKTIRQGRFQVSEGVAPSEVIRVFPGLKTLWIDETHKPFFESVMIRGTVAAVFFYDQSAGTKTILKSYYGMSDADLLADGVKTEIPKGYYAVPCIGKAGLDPKPVTVAEDGTVTYGDAVSGAGTAGAAVAFVARTVLEGQLAKPVGVLTMDAYRPFSRGENEGVSFVCQQYCEYPLLSKADGFDNSDIKVGDYIKPDALGRPVKWNPGEPEFLRIGQVIAREDLGEGATGTGASDYDFAFLNYMTLPIGNSLGEAMLKAAYGTPFGVRGLNDLMASGASVKGCFRVNLINL
jgi:hypothetical protein